MRLSDFDFDLPRELIADHPARPRDASRLLVVPAGAGAFEDRAIRDLPALLKECREFQSKIERGEAKLGEKKVDILPPDPIGELGSGWEKIQKERPHALPVIKS